MRIVSFRGLAAFLALCVLPLLLSCGSSNPAAPPPATGGPTWTVMVYMAADNTLAAAAAGDIDEMEKAGVNAKINVVVQAEFSPVALAKAGCDQPSCINRPNWNTFRYHVDGSGTAHDGPNGAATDIGNVDMTSPATLTEFVSWAKRTYPAQHYALVVWNHGGGYTGLIEDETSRPGHFMSLEDVRSSMTAVGKVDVINFDMCLMAGYETLSKIQGLADYVVFSEETEPGAGNPYDLILGAMYANTAMDPKTLATTIADKYNQSFSGDRASTTISAYDMSRFGAFETSLNTLASDLTSRSGVVIPALADAAAHSQKFTFPQLTDLGDLLDSLKVRMASDTVRAEIDALKTQASGAFRLRSLARNGSGAGQSAAVARATGLHIVLPSGIGQDVLPASGPASFTAYQALMPGKPWTQLLQAYLGGQGSADVADQGENRLETYLVWNPGAVAAGADMDFWVLEPNGNIFIPYLGSVTPNGLLTEESSKNGQYYEGYLTNRYVQKGVYKFYANLFADPNNFSPVFQLAYRQNQSDTAQFVGLFPPPLPRLDVSNPWRNDPNATLAKIDHGDYSDIVLMATFTSTTVPAPTGGRVFHIQQRGAAAFQASASGQVTAAQFATMRRVLGKNRLRVQPRTLRAAMFANRFRNFVSAEVNR